MLWNTMLKAYANAGDEAWRFFGVGEGGGVFY